MPGVVLSAGPARVEVDPGQGARITSWQVDGLELLGRRGDAPEEHGCYPMAPWCGRVRDNVVEHDGVRHALPETFHGWAIHGTVLRRAWEVQEVTDAEVRLATDLGADWPWPGRASATLALAPGSLTAVLEVEAGAAAFPAQAGWHPWFRRRLARGGAVERAMGAAALLARGPDHLPTGELLDPGTVPGPYDDAFEVPDGRVRLRWPGALRLTQASDARWVVVFDELDDFVCVEPQTGPPDGLRGPVVDVVAPGRPLRLTTTWSWEPDDAA